MNVREEIKNVLTSVLEELGVEGAEVIIEHPADLSHGDYSSNIALVAARRLGKNPMELAQAIVNKLRTENQVFVPSPGRGKPRTNIEKIEVAPPGFLNFWLSHDYLIKNLSSSERTGLSKKLVGRKIMVEFTDPNPFKEFHIGHLYSNVVGEALSRLIESQGAEVWRVNYQGDVGRHVAAAIWGMQKLKDEIPQKDSNLRSKVAFLGRAYAVGTASYESNDQAKAEIIELNRKIYSQDPQIRNLYEMGKQWSLDYFESIYKRLGTKFKHYYFESDAGRAGLKIVRDHLRDGIFEQSDGAIIFPGGKHRLHNRVFINSQGLPTYEAKELGLGPTKYKDFPYDQSIIVTGNEVNAYFEVVLKALGLINPQLRRKTKHIGHGMVRLPTGKMSSRTGQVITGEWLLDETKRRIVQAYPDMSEEAAEKVAIGAVKWALLKSGIGKDISFSFEESISLEGNSGPYLQYTYARTQSVLAKLETRNKFKIQKPQLPITNYELQPEELSLLRSLHHFPEVVEEAAMHFAPNLLCNYLFDLAQKFNLFYQKHKILPVIASPKGEAIPTRSPRSLSVARDDKETEHEVTRFRLALTAGVGQALKQGLFLLGIAAPERM